MGWKNVLRRDRNDGELRQELDAYLEEEAAENRARGMSPDEAARQASTAIGQRGTNGQPGGRSTTDGGLPSSTGRAPSADWSRRGTVPSRPIV